MEVDGAARTKRALPSGCASTEPTAVRQCALPSGSPTATVVNGAGACGGGSGSYGGISRPALADIEPPPTGLGPNPGLWVSTVNELLQRRGKRLLVMTETHGPSFGCELRDSESGGMVARVPPIYIKKKDAKYAAYHEAYLTLTASLSPPAAELRASQPRPAAAPRRRPADLLRDKLGVEQLRTLRLDELDLDELWVLLREANESFRGKIAEQIAAAGIHLHAVQELVGQASERASAEAGASEVQHSAGRIFHDLLCARVAAADGERA